jgi:mono/diheme cytochrome c family protein
VTHMSSGAASRVNLGEQVATHVDVNIRNDFGPRLKSEHLRSITVDPDEEVVITPGTCANDDTVRAPIGDPGDDFGGGGNCGYSGCATEVSATPGCLVAVDPNDQVIVTNPNQQGSPNGAVDDCFDCGFGVISSNPTQVLNQNEQRFVGTQIANPIAVALFDGGRGQILVNLGSKNALIMRKELRGRADDVIATVKLGNGAQGITLSPDGKLAYVFNQFDLTVSEIELPRVDDDVESRTKFVPDQNGEPVPAAELGVVPELAANTIELGIEDALGVEASIGRKLFHDATDARIAHNGTVSCASCHPDGRSDNRTWQFVFGPRNTPQLGGGILDTAPFHWPGDVPTVAALNDMTVLPFMGGSGLDSGSFSYVAAFIDTIRAAPSKAETQGMSEAALRGQEIFFSAATECSTCHAGAHFTNNLAYDVGTKASSVDISTFQTPVLHGLNRSAPYLHDGSQKTLDDLVNNVVASDRMGKGSHLTAQERSDLVEYLKTL